MRFIADLHIHSRYSRATSRELCFAQLAAWGQRKGIGLIGTGDCTHPGWLAEARDALEPAGDGLYRLKEPGPAPAVAGGADVRFLFTGEVSTIYKADGVTRKVHHLLCLPDLAAAERFAARLERIGNIASDGRPILGLDSRDLLEALLEVSADAVLIPAHIWTPWFSVLGSKSGFDSIAACYRDLAPHIFAVETGLSSDPPMNWTVSALDRYTLVSNSDAHSAGKLGREANVFTGEMGYTAVMDALRRKTPDAFWGTIEFFPEEGKYHYDGHRKCEFTCPPEESRRLDGRCPVCGGPLTLGVEYRVLELADRPPGARPANAAHYQRLLPLAEIVGEVLGTSASSKKVLAAYDRLLAEVGPELEILMTAELEAIRAAGGPLLALAIEKMREGRVHAVPGYDGEYGIIKVFTEEERAAVLGQVQLFGGLPFTALKRRLPAPAAPEPTAEAETAPEATPTGVSPEQQAAVEYPPAPLVIVAGPGAGKTRTLVERIARLIADGAAPEAVLALTFSNRAAREMAERLEARLAGATGRPLVATFHRFGFNLIQAQRERLGLPAPVRILAEEEAATLLAESASDGVANLDALEAALTALFAGASGDPASLRERAEAARQIAPAYAARKRALGALDFTDLLVLPLVLLAEDEDIRRECQARWPHVVVDEYQDVNVLQYHLLRLLCPAGSSVCVIGDPDQAIYGFRGADVRYFLRFTEDYPGAGQIALTRNYRSSTAIVQASSQVIAAGERLERPALWSTLPGPAQIAVTALPTPQAEAEHVVKTIEALLGGISHFSVDSGRSGDGVGKNLGFGDIAVLYRTHALGEEVQQALERSGIPYQRAARQELFHHPDVRALLALLAKDTCSQTPMQAVLTAAAALGLSAETLAQAPWPLLVQYARRANTLDEFFTAINFERDIDLYDPRAARVTLMTVHAAKGLEWDAVFLLGCEEGSFPHPAAPFEEERRLFYVGMTRARAHLFLSYAEARTQHGERAARRLCGFVQDIAPGLRQHQRPQIKRAKREEQLALTELL